MKASELIKALEDGFKIKDKNGGFVWDKTYLEDKETGFEFLEVDR